jgi:hypothetical protein
LATLSEGMRSMCHNSRERNRRLLPGLVLGMGMCMCIAANSDLVVYYVRNARKLVIEMSSTVRSLKWDI